MISLALVALSMLPKDFVVYEGERGPGKGKHIVFLAGDEEYRSEEMLPQLAKILAYRHGFKCTVLFSINEKGEIDPNMRTNQPGIEALDRANLCVMLLRFRAWPDSQMSHFVSFFLAGKPIIGLRTSTHAFEYPETSDSAYKKFGWRSKEWAGGFGKQILGESWVSHWGNHGSQSTRGIIAAEGAKHPVLRSVSGLFGTTDVYEASPPADSTILVRGEVVEGMNASDPPASGRKKTAGGAEQELNSPMMPVVWIREVRNESGKVNKVLTSTMGAATDLLNEGFRRMLVNGAYWMVGLEKALAAPADVGFVGDYKPSAFGFEGFKKGVKPGDLRVSPAMRR